jgi:fructokinase
MADVFRAINFPVVVSIGEALFDCFPDRSILGGAPVNFIVHVQQLLGSKGQAILVSRVGDDDLGRDLLEQLATRGIATDFVQIDREGPTGQVRVTVSTSGDPEFEIADNVAWDYIDFEDSFEQLARNCSAVCFGTLAQRSTASRATIHRLLASAPQAIRLLDVNLRQDYITRQILESSLVAANVVKLNENELARASQLLPSRLGGAATADDQAQALLNAFELRLLALTRGSRGTVLYTKEGRIDAAPSSFQAAENADGVGAGDACSAGLVCGLLMDWPLDRTLELANRMGAFLASQPGGTPQLPKALLDFVANQLA